MNFPSNGRKLRFRKYPRLLFLVFILIWILLALHPAYRFDWFLENLMVFIMIPVILFAYTKKALSGLSYTLLLFFMTLHIIGAHYTYSEVPAGNSISHFFGWQRNHYDRIVHFCFGLMLVQPVYELIRKQTAVSEKAAYFFSFSIIGVSGAVYELLEWVTAVIVAPEAGMAFLGTQGDQWDAQKDIAMKLLGSFLAVAIVAIKGIFVKK